jgi:hypothetical protein
MNVKLFSLLPGVLLAAGLFGAPQEQTTPGKTVANSFSQTLRLVQDDAQDYMVSRVFTLKYIQANDIAPFVTGMVKRYNMNSSVSCFSYSYGSTQQQILSVTTPEKMMHCVAEFLAKADRRIAGTPPGAEIIRGTGIARGVYRPKYRSGQILVNLIVQILAIRDDEEGEIARHLPAHLSGKEHHGVGLAGALGVPEHAQLSLQLGAIRHRFHQVVHA